MTQNQILTKMEKQVYKKIFPRMWKISNIKKIIPSDKYFTVTGDIMNSHKIGWYVAAFDKKWKLLTFEFAI